MSAAPVTVPDLQQLRDRMRLMEQPTARPELAAHTSVRALPRLRAGGSYEVSDLGVAMALLAGPTAAGDWCAVVGVPDFGVEAAAGLGVDLARTVLVPDPGEQWLEVVAVLADVVPLVLVRPVGRVAEGVVAKLHARLRRRGAVLVVHAEPGTWPRCEVRLRPLGGGWEGVGAGHGRLRSRTLTVQVRQGATPPTQVEVRLPGTPGDSPAVDTRRAPARTPRPSPPVRPAHPVRVDEAG